MLKKFVLPCLFLLVVCGCKDQTNEELFREGIKLSREGNYRGAVVVFNSCLEKDPNYFEARYYLAEAYLYTGKLDKAEKEFLKVSKLGGGFSQLPLRLGEVYLYTERPDAAITQVKRFLETNVGTSEAFDLMGRAFAIKKDFSQAEENFRKALDVQKDNFDAAINLVKVLMAQDRTTEARQKLIEITEEHKKNKVALYLLAELETANKNLEGALSAYEKISRIDPSETTALYMKGRILLSQGKVEDGDRIADDMLKRFPKASQSSLLKGLSLYLQKKHDEAVGRLQQSISKSPDSMAYYFLGLSYYNTEKYELALNQFQKILDVKPDFVQPRIMIAMIFLKQKRFDDAIIESQKIIRQNPSSGLGHNILGSAYMGLGEFEKAIQEFDRAVEIDPRLADAHFKKGLFSIRTGNLDEAERQLETAVALAPETLNTRIVLASHYLKRQDYKQAVDTLEGGLTGQEQDAVLYNYLSLAYFSQNQPEKALACLESAKKANPDFFPAYFNAASYHGKKGEFSRARQEYLSVVEKDPSNLRALIGMAITSEMEQKDEEAFSYFEKARKTNEPLGFIALTSHYNKKGELDQALTTLEEGLRLHPRDTALLNLQGQLLLKNRDFRGAETAYKMLEAVRPGQGYPSLVKLYQLEGEVGKAQELANSVIKSSPESPYGFLLSASISEQQKNLDKARETLEKGLETNQGNSSLLMAIGSIYAKLDNQDAALDVYRRLLDKNPDFYPATYAIGSIYDNLGQKKKALGYYEAVLTKNGEHTPTLNNLAYLYAVNYGELEKAVDLAMRAYRNEPGNPYVIDTLGFVLLKQGKDKEAAGLLKKAHALLPGSPTIQYHLALAAFKAGEKEKAVEFLQTALSSNDFPERKEAEDLLEKVK